MIITPRIYVNTYQGYRLSELSGNYELGKPIVVGKLSGPAQRIDIFESLKTRLQALTSIVTGHDYYRNRNYFKAIRIFQQASLEMGNVITSPSPIMAIWLSSTELHIAAETISLTVRERNQTLSRVIQYAEILLKSPEDQARGLLIRSQAYFLMAHLPSNDSASNSIEIDLDFIERSARDAIAAMNTTSVLADDVFEVHIRSRAQLGICRAVRALALNDVLLRKQAEIEFTYIVEQHAKIPRMQERITDVMAEVYVWQARFTRIIDNDSAKATRLYVKSLSFLIDNEPRYHQINDLSEKFRPARMKQSGKIAGRNGKAKIQSGADH